MNPLSSIAPVQPVSPLSGAQPAGRTSSATSFSSLLESAINRVETSSSDAAKMTEKFIAGEGVDLHSVALAGQKASLQFEMLLQVRNKVVQAYQEVMRIQL